MDIQVKHHVCQIGMSAVFVPERFIRCMTYQTPDELPIMAAVLPAAFLRHGKSLNALLARYPEIYDNYWITYDFERDCPPRYRVGQHTDEWGCVWHNRNEGLDGYVHGHPIAHRDGISDYTPPQNLSGYLPHGFMYLRILDLRGFEEAMFDFAEEPPELSMLLEKVTEVNVRHVEALCREKSDPVIIFGDDLGMQNGLAIGAEKWRRLLAPCFKRVYDVCKRYNRYVFMHTDGQIYEIMPDLQKAGVDMINPQFRANGLDNLVRICKGKIPICLDLDRQLFPFASPAELRRHVEEAVAALWIREGGLALNVELGAEVPLENMEALLSTLDGLRHYTA